MANLTKEDKIYVAGHRGLVGSAIVRSLKRSGYTNIIGRTHAELDLTNQAAVQAFFSGMILQNIAQKNRKDYEMDLIKLAIRKPEDK